MDVFRPQAVIDSGGDPEDERILVYSSVKGCYCMGTSLQRLQCYLPVSVHILILIREDSVFLYNYDTGLKQYRYIQAKYTSDKFKGIMN